jgi:hypothetical protein
MWPWWGGMDNGTEFDALGGIIVTPDLLRDALP